MPVVEAGVADVLSEFDLAPEIDIVDSGAFLGHIAFALEGIESIERPAFHT